MKVLVGPNFSIEVSSSPPVAFVVPNSSSQDEHRRGIFLEEDEVGGSGISSSIGSGIGINNGPEESSDSSSSIGAPDDSEDEEEGEEVESVGLSKGSLDSLEESLPIKRGLSNHFTGKSKSFANLSEVSCVSTVKDLEKPENPFNKRRRLLMANKWCRKSSFYSWANPKSMPLLTLNEEEEDDVPEPQQEDDDEEPEDNYQVSPSSSSSEQDVLRNHHQQKLSKFQDKKFKASFKSHSCFSLTDLQDQPFH